MAALPPGTVLGERFTIVGRLGHGGMATVYLADDQMRGERVALKLPHAHLTGDPSTTRRLRREVQAAARIQHPNALVAYDLHELDGTIALSMPYHPGRTLAERVAAEGPLPPDQVRRLALRLAEVLAAAHRAGVLHRDVSPHNVMLDDRGSPSLTDFGLARVDGTATRRSTGLLGTAGYTAPELMLGERADPRTDLYGLGAVLYFASTGRPPFDPARPTQALHAHMAGEVPALDAPALPAWLATTLRALVHPDPNRRPQGAPQLVRSLTDGRSPRAEAPPPPALSEPEAPSPGTHLVFPRGDWTVLIQERTRDNDRRHRWRAKHGMVDVDARAAIQSVGEEIKKGLMDFAGLPVAKSPERRLTDAVATLGGMRPEDLDIPDAALERKFRLVSNVDESTARALVTAAKAAGFQATRATDRRRSKPTPSKSNVALVVVAAVSCTFLIQATEAGLGIVMGMLALFIFLIARQSRRHRMPGRWRARPIAFPARYRDAPPSPESPPELAHQVDATPPAQATPATQGARLQARAEAAISALATTARSSDMPAPALDDLRRTVKSLRAEAARLGPALDRLDAELDSSPAPTDTTWATDRLSRIDTLRRAGDTIDPEEQIRLVALVEQAADTAAATDALEARRNATMARLLELSAAATQARHTLAAAPEPASADAIAQQLQKQARAWAATRRELG